MISHYQPDYRYAGGRLCPHPFSFFKSNLSPSPSTHSGIDLAIPCNISLATNASFGILCVDPVRSMGAYLHSFLLLFYYYYTT